MIKIIVDATNIKAGGGLTHLSRILEFSEQGKHNIEVVGGDWLKVLKDKPGINKVVYSKEFRNIFKQEIFKTFHLGKLLSRGDISFIPGGTFASKKIPYISMSQNMLVFESEERNRFPLSFTWLRYHLLEYMQVRSFKKAKGIIYISEYAKSYIEGKYPSLTKIANTVIYHGISDDFRQIPKEQLSIESYSFSKPFKLLYISIVNYYKHQWNLVEAVKRLYEEGFPIELEMIGPMYEPVRKRLEISMTNADAFVSYKGKIAYEEIAKSYKSSDLFIFASTCENMPNILVEAMSAGLPILSSNYGPMPEILKDGGVYMDPIEVDSIYINLKIMLLDENLRTKMAEKAYKYSLDFSWEKTSKETFDFINKVAQERN